MKPPTYYRNKEQTYLKHFFLERYLQTLAFHIGYSQREFVYVDCFSGPWRSDDEELADTSIRIALDQLNYVRDGLEKQGKDPAVRAIFIEKSPTAFSALQRALAQHSRGVRTTAYEGTFEDNIPRILLDVGPAFTFFFIDPRGWTGFAMEQIRPILQHQPGEVMVNFMYDFINRFLNYPDAANEQSLDEFFGTRTWREIRDQPDRETASVDLYTGQLRSVGHFRFATSTRILKPLHNRAYFHLIYATRNPKGILEFRKVEKETFKEQDIVRAAAQRENREERSGQTELDFGVADNEPTTSRHQERDQQLSKAKVKIDELTKHGPIRFEELQPQILELPLVWSADLNEILMELFRNGTLMIEGFGPRQRVAQPSNVIRRT